MITFFTGHHYLYLFSKP